jgi:copper chaperone CopZ
VAVNCSVVPGAIEGVAGVTAIDTSVAAVTVRVTDPLTEPDVAVIVVVPCATLVASPVVEAMVAPVGSFELHCTVPVMFCVLPSLNVPVAVNCCVTLSGRVGIAGVTEIETSVAAVTVTFAEALIEPEVAVTPVLPIATLLAFPRLLTVATLEFALLHVAVAVRSRVLPSL